MYVCMYRFIKIRLCILYTDLPHGCQDLWFHAKSQNIQSTFENRRVDTFDISCTASKALWSVRYHLETHRLFAILIAWAAGSMQTVWMHEQMPSFTPHRQCTALRWCFCPLLLRLFCKSQVCYCTKPNHTKYHRRSWMGCGEVSRTREKSQKAAISVKMRLPPGFTISGVQLYPLLRRNPHTPYTMGGSPSPDATTWYPPVYGGILSQPQ